jgi:hypothetical protein
MSASGLTEDAILPKLFAPGNGEEDGERWL